MKKVMVIISILILSLFIVGCLDYKAYDVPKEEPTDDVINPEGIKNVSTETKEIVVPEPKNNVSDETVSSVITVKENEWVKLKINITDPDKDEISYTFSTPLNKKGEWKTNYGDAGEYITVLTASDGKLTAESRIKIVVQRQNVAPIIETPRDMEVKEGYAVRFEPRVRDPNSDPITVTVSEPLSNGAWVTDHKSAGTYTIKVTASDGELQSEKTFKLTINDVNVPPEVSGLADLRVKEGELVKIQPVVSDYDGDKVKVTISDPVGDDGLWQTGYTNHGEYNITITLNDGKETVTKTVKLVVEDVNMPPQIVGISLQ